MSVPHVFAAISAVMKTMSEDGISKDRKNQQQGYSFRGIDDIYNALGKVMAEHKLAMLPRVVGQQREERATQRGGTLTYTILTVEFDLVSGVDGSKHVICTIGEAMDSADKSSNKAMSAAYKYAALMAFAIPTEGDNDADATTHEPAPRRAAAKPQAPAPQAMPDDEYDRLVALIKASGTTEKSLKDWYKVGDLRHLNQEQYGEAVKGMTDRLAKRAQAQTNDDAGEFAGLNEGDLK